MNVKDLMKSYGNKAVVKEVSFTVPKGKVLSLIGPNGAGKSTVMGMISRLVAKDAGVISFEGEEAHLDKNYFDITGRAPVRIRLTTPRMTTVEKLKRVMRICSLCDLGRED